MNGIKTSNDKLIDTLSCVNDIKLCLEALLTETDGDSNKSMIQICNEHNIDYFKFKQILQSGWLSKIRSKKINKPKDVDEEIGQKETERIIDKFDKSITEENSQKLIDIDKINQIISKEKLYVLELSTRSYNVLSRSGIATVYDLLQKSYYDLIMIRHLGKASINDALLKLDVYLHNKFGTNRVELRKSLGMSDGDYPAPKVVHFNR